MRTQTLAITGIFIMSFAMLLISGAAHAELDVTLIPAVYSIQTIHPGEISAIEIQARATGGEKYEWTLEGPGRFDRGAALDSVVVYYPPTAEQLEEESATVTIGVTVTDGHGEKGTEKIMFTLVNSTSLPLPTPTPTPIRIREIHVKDDDGVPLPPRYFVEPGQQIRIELVDSIPPDQRVRIKSDAVFGIAEPDGDYEILYTAPKGEVFPPDTVKIELVNEETGETIAKKLLDINFLIKKTP